MKRKNLKAYVRLDKNGQPIGGSMIYRDKQPYGKFKPLLNPYGDVCCPPTPSNCSELGYWLEQTNYGEQYVFSGFSVNSAVDANCNVYKLSYSTSFEQPFPATNVYPIFVQKFTGEGVLVWQKKYSAIIPDNTIFQRGQSISVGVDGYVYIAATSLVYKINPNDGAIIWTKYYNCSDIECNVGQSNYEILHLPNGRMYIVSEEYDTLLGNLKFTRLTEINPTTGDALANSKRFGRVGDPGVYTSYVHKVTPDNHIITGFIYTSQPGFWPSAIIKLDADLNVVWAKEPVNPGEENPDWDELNGIVADTLGNVYLTYGYGANATIVKLDVSGNLIWSKLLNWPASVSSYGLNLVIDSSDNPYVVMIDYTNSLIPQNFNTVAVISLTKDGNVQNSYNLVGANPPVSVLRGWNPYNDVFVQMKGDVLYIHFMGENVGLSFLLKAGLTTPSIPPSNISVSTVVPYATSPVTRVYNPYSPLVETTLPLVNTVHSVLVTDAPFTTITYAIV